MLEHKKNPNKYTSIWVTNIKVTEKDKELKEKL